MAGFWNPFLSPEVGTESRFLFFFFFSWLYRHKLATCLLTSVILDFWNVIVRRSNGCTWTSAPRPPMHTRRPWHSSTQPGWILHKARVALNHAKRGKKPGRSLRVQVSFAGMRNAAFHSKVWISTFHSKVSATLRQLKSLHAQNSMVGCLWTRSC